MFAKLPARVLFLLSALFVATQSISWGSACSGSDCMAIALEEISRFASDTLNKQVHFKHIFSCEKDKKKRTFLARCWSFALLIPNTVQLAKNKVTNLLDQGKEVFLPWVYLYVAGFSCVSLSTLNPNS